jgi:hypothetical protein
MTSPAWPPAIGEPIGHVRAVRAMWTAREEIAGVTATVVREIEQRHPGVPVNRTLVTAAALARERRTTHRGGVVVGVIDYVDPGGTRRVIAVQLGWDGTVSVPRQRASRTGPTTSWRVEVRDDRPS